jgi:N-acylneuraminate cytidylyltransferase
MKITAVIPIRSGSQRVRDKNLRQFGDTNLMQLKIDNLLQVPEIDEIVVNTNSEEAIKIVCEQYQGKVKYHRREEYYASSKCTNSEFFRHLGETTDTDVFLYCPCTSPFTKPETISKCIKQFLSSDEHDCLATVSNVKEFLWLDGKSLNYDINHQPNSQNLPNIYALNFAISIAKRDDLIRNSNIMGEKPDFVVTDEVEGLDIDTPLDFFTAEQLYKRLVIEKKPIINEYKQMGG